MKLSKNIPLSVLVLLFLINGCTSLVRSDVAVFHVLPEKALATGYAFLALEGQEASLEYAAYRDLIRVELSKYQYEEVGLDEASVILAFKYGIGSGREKVVSVPIFGQTGVSSSTTFGTIQSYGSYGTFSGTTTYTPTYGVKGSMPFSVTQYMRWLNLCMVDKSSFDKGTLKIVYEASVVSEGKSSQLAAVVPAMIRSLFKEFPGKSISTRTEFFPSGK